MTHTKETRELLKSINEFLQEFLQTDSLLTTSDAEVMRFAKRITHIAGSLDVYKHYDEFDHDIRRFQDKADQYVVDVEGALRALWVTKECISYHLYLDSSDTRQG